MRFINPNNNQIEKHIDYCEYMVDYCNRKSNDKKSFYFKKQIQVAKNKLKKNEKNNK